MLRLIGLYLVLASAVFLMIGSVPEEVSLNFCASLGTIDNRDVCLKNLVKFDLVHMYLETFIAHSETKTNVVCDGNCHPLRFLGMFYKTITKQKKTWSTLIVSHCPFDCFRATNVTFQL